MFWHSLLVFVSPLYVLIGRLLRDHRVSDPAVHKPIPRAGICGISAQQPVRAESPDLARLDAGGAGRVVGLGHGRFGVERFLAVAKELPPCLAEDLARSLAARSR